MVAMDSEGSGRTRRDRLIVIGLLAVALVWRLGHFVEMEANEWGFPTDQLAIWEFHVDWVTPSNSTFGSNASYAPNLTLATAAYDPNMCGYAQDCIPQPGTSMGVDAIWVSNHGGRQLDGSISSIAALPAISDAVGGKADLIIDSGIRRGSDIFKARARGAAAAAVGRAALFGAAAGGPGVGRALDILIEELALTMKLSGTPAFRAIGPDLLT